MTTLICPFILPEKSLREHVEFPTIQNFSCVGDDSNTHAVQFRIQE